MGLSFKNRFIMLHRKHTLKAAEELNNDFEFFVQCTSPASRYVRGNDGRHVVEKTPTKHSTVKVQAQTPPANKRLGKLSFVSVEHATFDFDPAQIYDVYCRRRSDGAIVRVFSNAYCDDGDVDDDGWCIGFVHGAECPLISKGDDVSLSMLARCWYDNKVEGELPIEFKPGHFTLADFEWRTYTGWSEKVEEFDVNELHSALQGAPFFVAGDASSSF